MATFLFDKTIFGPVKSRRLGSSLGINLLPTTRKVCSYNCIYCECGWNQDHNDQEKLPVADEVIKLLDEQLKKMKDKGDALDFITFAGNGEPTLHPEFPEIIEETITLRNKYFPEVKIAVLSNSSQIHKKNVFDALNRVDKNILKIDSAFAETCRQLNKPVGNFNIEDLVQNLTKFKGNVVIQTMFLRGVSEGIPVDNTTEVELNAWLEVIKKIRPKEVMIYSIDRDTPAENLEKIPLKKLKEIAFRVEQLGFNVVVSG
jgi:wyosine [tRNA(Phe)-imidazoG37] synthetase (radical SAM superfamily)